MNSHLYMTIIFVLFAFMMMLFLVSWIRTDPGFAFYGLVTAGANLFFACIVGPHLR